MFDVEFNSAGYKTLAAPRVCLRGSLGFFLLSFCVFLLVLFLFSSRALPGCIAGEGDARDGVRLVVLNLTRRIHITGSIPARPLCRLLCPQAGNKPKARRIKQPFKII